jgi:hypothetical protein
MSVSVHQPDFIPWVGYFEKIRSSKQFYILDDVQLSRRGWTHRDKLILNNLEKWLTIPIKKKGNFDSLIKDIKIDNDIQWKKKHLSSIKMSYGKAQNFAFIFKVINDIYNKNHNYLIDLNLDFIEKICEVLKIKVSMEFTSSLKTNSSGSNRILDIAKLSGEKIYLTGEPSLNYLDINAFKNAGIAIKIFKLDVNEYKKKYFGFNSKISCLDYLFNAEKV